MLGKLYLEFQESFASLLRSSVQFSLLRAYLSRRVARGNALFAFNGHLTPRPSEYQRTGKPAARRGHFSPHGARAPLHVSFSRFRQAPGAGHEMHPLGNSGVAMQMQEA